jgi:hypothetical protein
VSVNARAISGTVKTTTGVPIEGVMVIGSDLNYAETDVNGRFELKDPDCALVFWCTGFKPRPQLVQRGVSDPIEVILNAL